MKTSLALIAAGMFTASLYALPDYDPFADATGSGGTAYNVGDPLIGQKDALGQTWVQAGPVNATQPKIALGNLTYSGLPASQGNSVSFGGNGESARLPLSSAVTSGTIYYSFLMDVTSLGSLTSSGVFWAGFNNSTGSSGTSPSTVGTRLYARTSGSGFQLGVNENSSSITTWDTAIQTVGSTLFIVGSYTFNTSSSSDDVSALWINPTIGSATPPSATVSATGGTDLSTVASFVLCDRIASEPSGILDDFRASTSYADVTAVPEPATAALAGLGLLALVLRHRSARR